MSATAVWVSAAVAAIALAGCDAMPGRPKEADREVLPSQVTDFAVLYAQNCAACHGADGRLGAAQPLNDSIYQALAPTARIQAVIARGVPGGISHAFATSAGGPLTDEQIEILVREMRTRWGRAGELAYLHLPPYSAADTADGRSGQGDPQRGMAVYATTCAGCHGSDEKGGSKAGSVVDPAFLALVTDQALRTAVIAGRPDLGMPDWSGNGSWQPLSPQQISDVVAWLVVQRRAPSDQPPALGVTPNSRD